MKQPQEYKVVSLRECPTPDTLRVCETPQQAADYWRLHIAQHPYYNPDCECFVVLMLNVRRRVKGHHLVTIGTLDTILVTPREAFRTAVVASAAAVILMHNLCEAAHKLCYVTRGVMCSHASATLGSTRFQQRRECYATH